MLLDYGGVMTTSVGRSFAAFCSDEGVEVGTFRRVVMDALADPGSVFAKVEIGAIADDAFDEAVADLLGRACGRTLDPVGLKKRLFAQAVPDPVMEQVVRTARTAGVATALVSNSWGLSTYPRERLEELFDAVVLSGEIGLRKPDPDIYLLAAMRVGAPPERCVFVDDLELNVRGAEAVGMTGVLHSDVEQTVGTLQDLLGINLMEGVPPGSEGR